LHAHRGANRVRAFRFRIAARDADDRRAVVAADAAAVGEDRVADLRVVAIEECTTSCGDARVFVFSTVDVLTGVAPRA
jgi:hypothetical protein